MRAEFSFDEDDLQEMLESLISRTRCSCRPTSKGHEAWCKAVETRAFFAKLGSAIKLATDVPVPDVCPVNPTGHVYVLRPIGGCICDCGEREPL